MEKQMRNIQIVPLSRMEEMRKYFNKYLVELSEFDPNIKFDDKGIPIYNWFDRYWAEKSRFPIFLIVDNNVAGLAMIRELGNMFYEIAEYYIHENYRKDGNAIWFANEIANLFEGEFVFSTIMANKRAVKFWDKFVSQFENNSFCDNDGYRHWTIRKNNFQSHTLRLNPIYFNLIKMGKKTLEGRLNDEKRQNFHIGDVITFYKEPERVETIKAIILDKYLFKNFEEMSKNLDKNALGFEDSTKEQMVNVYRTIYSHDDENKYGVVIFKIKVID